MTQQHTKKFIFTTFLLLSQKMIPMNIGWKIDF